MLLMVMRAGGRRGCALQKVLAPREGLDTFSPGLHLTSCWGVLQANTSIVTAAALHLHGEPRIA
jgi:hypothetical protein